ncbi:CpsD/CapB family tyrosine-protein kinase [Bacillus sp. 2205SS5-2]|uniref:CpsD/CapB family tyrosine-protein kinase n=1 Tax=Bacillus sp. 2205SS5-2 TaxID=3109031 RepID=UPI0030047A3D
MLRTIRKTKYIAKLDEGSKSTEQIRMVRGRLDSIVRDQNSVLLVTSPSIVGETAEISFNLALSYTEQGFSVLLVDASFRDPILHDWFEVSLNASYRNFLNGEKIGLYAGRTNISNLSFLSFGEYQSSHPLWSKDLEQSIEELKKDYEYIIILAPPFQQSSDTQMISQYCDGVILVVKECKEKIQELKKTIRHLEHISAPLKGIIYQNK